MAGNLSPAAQGRLNDLALLEDKVQRAHGLVEQLAGSMELAARRGLSPMSKVRILREGVGSMKFQIELAQRAIISEEAAAAQKKQAEPAPDGG